MGYETDYEASR